MYAKHLVKLLRIVRVQREQARLEKCMTYFTLCVCEAELEDEIQRQFEALEVA